MLSVLLTLWYILLTALHLQGHASQSTPSALEVSMGFADITQEQNYE